MEGSTSRKKPGVINMPSWKGVMSDAQANAIAAYVLAGFPQVGAPYDFNAAKASDIYSDYACIDCHGQVGRRRPRRSQSGERRQGSARCCATRTTT